MHVQPETSSVVLRDVPPKDRSGGSESVDGDMGGRLQPVNGRCQARAAGREVILESRLQRGIHVDLWDLSSEAGKSRSVTMCARTRCAMTGMNSGD